MLWNRFSVCFVRSWSRDALKEIIFFTRECLKFNFFCSSFFFFLRFLNFSFFSSSRIQRRLRQAREEKKMYRSIIIVLFCAFAFSRLDLSLPLSLSLMCELLKRNFSSCIILYVERDVKPKTQATARCSSF